MRVTYRQGSVRDYWAQRWDDIPADRPMGNPNVYPLKYAERILRNASGPILEAGCGAGRVLRFYHDKGYDITGIDFIQSAITKLREVDTTLRVEVGDITKLRFDDEAFQFVLAFGLYHNLEHGIEKALSETHRVLQPSGRLCASFRADNVHSRMIDALTAYGSPRSGHPTGEKTFHKLNLQRSECVQLVKDTGFIVEDVYAVENMPIWYKFPMFRARTQRRFDENVARTEGYTLTPLARAVQNFAMRWFPDHFCNVFVIVAQKESASA